MNFRNMFTAMALVVTAMASAPATAGALDDYNAKYVNSASAKKSTINEVCNSLASESDTSNTINVHNCADFKRNGVPNGDIRHAIIAASVITGAAATAAAATVAVPALGGKTLFAQWGVKSLLGAKTITLGNSALFGAAVGGALGATTYYRR